MAVFMGMTLLYKMIAIVSPNKNLSILIELTCSFQSFNVSCCLQVVRTKCQECNDKRSQNNKYVGNVDDADYNSVDSEESKLQKNQ